MACRIEGAHHESQITIAHYKRVAGWRFVAGLRRFEFASGHGIIVIIIIRTHRQPAHDAGRHTGAGAEPDHVGDR